MNDIHPADFAYAILLWVYLLVSPGCRAVAAMRDFRPTPVWLRPLNMLKRTSAVPAQHMINCMQ